MPAVPEGKVLVSGCNGYIAVWVVKLLLEDGFSVRGTVRRESVIPYLKEFFKSYGDKFEVVIVPDITKEGAFDEAVKGVDAIEHTASPFSLNADDPQEIIGPAVAGTVGMLDSAFRVANDTVRRIIVTSSCSSVLTVDPTNMKLNFFSERDWNEQSVREVEEKGRSADNIDKYHASKSLAERAAWKWAEEHRGVAKFDVVALNPPYVYGPVLHDVKSADALNTSMLDFYNTIVKQNKSPEYIATLSQSWVDVRDIGLAHIRALHKEEAGSERIIVSSGPWNWNDFIKTAHKIEPSLPAGDLSYDPETAVYKTRFDNSKSKRILEIEYRGMEETTRDCLAQFKGKGWL